MNKKSIEKSNVLSKEKYENRKEVLTSFFSDEAYKSGLSIKQIAAIFGVPKKEMEQFRNILAELETEAVIVIDENKKCFRASDKGYVKGIYEARSKKFGFVTSMAGDEFYIPEGHINGAMDKDTVLIRAISGQKKTSKRVEADIVKVLKRANRKVIGKYIKNSNFGFVEPLDGKTEDIFIPKKFMGGYNTGDIVEVQLLKYALKDANPEGKIISLIGKKDEEDEKYVKALYKSFGLDMLSVFSPFVENELLSVPDEVTLADEIGRVDKTQLNVVTIDSEDAKDLDDGCYVEKLPNGMYVLSVFIADVSHYVKASSNLDKEAISRGTSIYIPGTVVPMLPKKLSNGICSLNAGVKRLAIGVDIVIDTNGKVVSSQVYKAVIKVRKKMTYEKVYKVLQRSDKDVLEEYKDYIEDLDTMLELSKLLYKQRKANGSIDFDIPELKVQLDEEGKLQSIKPYDITEANKIIEEFMLITNMVIAEKFFFLDMPFIYRVHERPDEEKLRDLNGLLLNYGIKLKGVKNIHPKTLATVIDSIEDEKVKEVISSAMLRTLKIAKYSNECLGHFGLAAKYYTHFTSPIRRYPDLFIHRVISDYLENNGHMSKNKLDRYEKQAYNYSYSSSEAEKNATKIEREFINLYEVMYMKRFIDKEFEGAVSSITSFGMFVRLENQIEGFVPFECMPGNDYYYYDDERKVLIGRHSSKVFKVSDKVKVRLIRADVSLKQIDFEILEVDE